MLNILFKAFIKVYGSEIKKYRKIFGWKLMRSMIQSILLIPVFYTIFFILDVRGALPMATLFLAWFGGNTVLVYCFGPVILPLLNQRIRAMHRMGRMKISQEEREKNMRTQSV